MPTNNNPPLYVHWTSKDYVKPAAGGGKKKVFDEVDDGFRNQLFDQLTIVEQQLSESFTLNPKLPGVARLILKEEALAKSHRPTPFLDVQNCPVIGTGNLGELFISVTKDSLKKLQGAIKTTSTQAGISQISTISDIKAYTETERLSECLEVDFAELIKQKIKIQIFDHRNEQKNLEIQAALLAEMNRLRIREAHPVKYGRYLRLVSARLDSADQLRELSNFIAVQKASAFPIYKVVRPAALFVSKMEEGFLPMPDPRIHYPVIGVVDSGIDPEEKSLVPWVSARHNYIPGDLVQSYVHGTFVAGLAVHARKLNHDDARFPGGPVKIVDVAALPDGGISEDELLAILEEVVPQHPEVKVWNLSLSSDTPCQTGKFSDLAVALDDLQERYDVTFVLAAGNYNQSPRTWPPEDLGESDRVTAPADSARALTVGSLAHNSVANSLVKSEFPSPFSRRGPGAAFMPKPEVSHYGGNCNNQFSCLQVGILSLDGKGNIVEDIGTSFSTPLVSNSFAHVRQALGDSSSSSYSKAVLIHSAALSGREISASDLRYFGFGVPGNIENLLLCNDWEATSIFEPEIIPAFEFIKDFPIPPCLRTPDGRTTGEFTVTLVYNPPLDPRFGSEYCRTNVDVSLGTYDEGPDGKFHHQIKVPLNPVDLSQLYERKLVEHGFKWSPVKVYRKVIPQGIAGNNWRLKISANYRDQFSTDQPQTLTVIVTVRDPKQTKPVYTEFRAAANAIGWATTEVRIDEQVRVRT